MLSKIRKYLLIHPHHCVVLIAMVVLTIFYSPVWLENKHLLNGNFLVSFYSPWKFNKFTDYPTGVPSKQGGGYDPLRIGYPYFGLVNESWKNFEIPLWNSYNFSGLPLAAETQSAAFYPIQFLSFFLSQMEVWTIFTISGFFFIFLFTHLYLYNLTDNLLASIFGSFVFAFNTFFIAWNQEVITAIHAAMWLPLILLAIDKMFLEKKIIKWWIILLLSLVMSILSGYIQITFYVFGFASVYLIWNVVKGRKFFFKDARSFGLHLIFIIAPFFLSVLLTTFQTIPLYEMYSLSSRPIINMKQFLISYLLPFYSVIQILIPDFFGNSGTWNHFGFRAGTFYEHTYSIATLALLFSLSAIIARRINNKKYFFFIAFIVSLILAHDSPVSRIIFSLNIPVLSSSIANRILFIPPFCLAVLSAIGIKSYLDRKIVSFNKALLIAVISLSVFYLVIFIWLLYSRFNNIVPFNFTNDWITISLRNSVIPILVFISGSSFILVSIVKPKIRSIVVVFIIFITIGQMFYEFRKTTAFSPSQFIYPDAEIFKFLREKGGNYRFWSFGEAYINNNIATQMHVYNSEGYDSLANRRYAQLLKVSDTKGLWTDKLSRSDVGISKPNSLNELLLDKYKLRLFTLTSTRFIFYKPSLDVKENNLELFSDLSKNLRLIKNIGGVELFEYLRPLPRIIFIPKAEIISNKQEIIDRLFSADFDPAKDIILEKSGNLTTEEDPKSWVIIKSYRSNNVRINAVTNTPQWLLLTDSFYPGWHAYIDGKKTEIFRANFAFRAIQVMPGRHKIEFRYWPVSFTTGLKISSITLFIVILFIFIIRKTIVDI